MILSDLKQTSQINSVTDIQTDRQTYRIAIT